MGVIRLQGRGENGNGCYYTILKRLPEPIDEKPTEPPSCTTAKCMKNEKAWIVGFRGLFTNCVKYAVN